MKVQEIGSRGFLFTFPDFIPYPQVPMPIQIYVINGKNNLFICDTGVKKEQIDMLKKHLTDKKLLSKPLNGIKRTMLKKVSRRQVRISQNR